MADVTAPKLGMTMGEALANLSPVFSIPSKTAVLADLADRAAALAPPYEYGHTLTNRAGDFDQILHAMAEYMVNPDTATLAPFDYAMPEMAAVGWMAGGYEAEGRSAGAGTPPRGCSSSGRRGGRSTPPTY